MIQQQHSECLKSLPIRPSECATISILDLSKCGNLTNLPDQIGDCTSLVTLDLSNCLIVHLHLQ